MKSSEELLGKVGCHHKYQMLISLLFIFIGTLADFTSVFMPMMTSPPKVSFYDENGVKKDVYDKEIYTFWRYWEFKEPACTFK